MGILLGTVEFMAVLFAGGGDVFMGFVWVVGGVGGGMGLFSSGGGIGWFFGVVGMPVTLRRMVIFCWKSWENACSSLGIFGWA